MVKRIFRKQNLLQKLANRELFGHFVRGVPLNYEPAKQLFHSIPSRLIFRLADTIPNLDNHILMGATRCGMLLLTYTYNADTSSDYSPNMVYRYRLHFWGFSPGRAACKVAEVQLFDSCVITEVLTIGICQWANNNYRLLIYGFCHGPDNTDGWGTECEYKSTTYITVTTVPSLNGCIDCRAVAASFDEEEMAANWDSGVGLTCMRHGLTVHTHFSVPHVNTFDPHTCMASDSEILVNTGAFLHVLSLRLERGGSRPPLNSPSILSLPVQNKMTYGFLRNEGYSIFLSENWANKMKSLLLGSKIDMNVFPHSIRFAVERHLQLVNPGVSLIRVVAPDVLYSRPKVQKWFRTDKTSRISFTSRKRAGKRSDEPDKIYDFKESEEVTCEPGFKLFRRRCLADKMYEFRGDEDHNVENIRPLDTKDKCKIAEMEENCSNDDEGERGMHLKTADSIDNIVGAIMADWESDGEMREGESRCHQALKPHNSPSGRHLIRPIVQQQQPQSPLMDQSQPTKPPPQSSPPQESIISELKQGFGHREVSGCSVRFSRRYIEIDQEITSTITDIEDDEMGTGFHCALPLSLHGSAYSQMEMISNQKAEKLGICCAVVDQSSLDIEQFCFKAAEAICKMEGYKFWFCSDYDTDIIWMCPCTSDVYGVLFIRINAEECSKTSSENKKRADVRNFYEASCLYVWSPSSGEVHLEGYRWGSWGPGGARAAPNLKRAFQACTPPVRAVIHRVEEGSPVLPLNLILDHDNLIGFRRLP